MQAQMGPISQARALSPQSQSTLEAPLFSSHYHLHKGQPGQVELCHSQSQGITQRSLGPGVGPSSAYYTVFGSEKKASIFCSVVHLPGLLALLSGLEWAVDICCCRLPGLHSPITQSQKQKWRLEGRGSFGSFSLQWYSAQGGSCS